MSLLDGWKLCPRCGNQLTPSKGRVDCAGCGFVLYAHSAVTASALPEDGRRRVLLARRAIEPALGKWDCVGGFVEEGEHPLDGVRREVREETGLEFTPGRFLGIWMGRYEGRATLNLFWTGALAAGQPRPDDDIAELRWFAADEVPNADELAFQPLIADVLQAWRNEQP
ncbi:MAG TPA: NUDIX domain-containing protein [Gaiellaceae bacterium]|nr:NUDIX domain-containing protein [Gaiellaceae bacterium]